MSCSCGPSTSCRSSSVPKTGSNEDQIRKYKQLTLYGIVWVLFILRWFHIVDTFIGIDLNLLAIFIGSAPIFSKALEALLKKDLNTDTLVVIAIIAALAVPKAHFATAPWLGVKLNRLISSQFFPAGSVIIIMLGIEILEMFTLIKMKTAVDALVALAPQKARIRRGPFEVEIDIAQVKVNDVLIVKPGESIPVDGIISRGSGSINESAITGEGLPVEKSENSLVLSGTICELGAFEMVATKVGEDTTISRIIRLIKDAQNKKPEIQKYADKMARIFIPSVLAIAALFYIFTGDPIKTAAVLLVACPCALSMATPAAVIAGIGNGARKGILIKGGIFLESAADVDCVVFDKTGTLTFGKPEVTDVMSINGMDERKILAYAASAEKLSEHPLSTSVLQETNKRKITYFEPDLFKVFPGKGIFAKVRGENVLVGNRKLFKDNGIEFSSEAREKITGLEQSAKTILIVAVNGIIEGVIAVADILKDDAIQAVRQLREIGIKKIVLLSGDNETVSQKIGRQLGVDEVRASMSPEDKVLAVEELKKEFKVAMVGDGINDAPALSASNVAIAMGSGTDVSIASADIILKTNDVRKVVEALRLGRRTLTTIKGNIIFSMAYNVLGIALSAIGLFIPAFAVIFQEAGCFSVMLNSALLIRFKEKSLS
jgi:Cu+-exporting ATPase